MAPSSFLLSSHLSGGLFEKIRTPSIPHKEKISTQQGNGFIGSASMVGHEINDVFRGMNRRMQGLKSDISDLKSIIIFEGVKAWQTLRPFALPVRITFCGKIDFYRGTDIANSRAPLLKSACMWVSATAEMRSPSASAMAYSGYPARDRSRWPRHCAGILSCRNTMINGDPVSAEET
jgi:hypothetical protein